MNLLYFLPLGLCLLLQSQAAPAMERPLQDAARMMADERGMEPQVGRPWYGPWGGWGFPRGSGAPTPNTPNTPNRPSFLLEDDDRDDERLVQPAASLARAVMTEAFDEDFADDEAEMQAAFDAEVCALNVRDQRYSRHHPRRLCLEHPNVLKACESSSLWAGNHCTAMLLMPLMGSEDLQNLLKFACTLCSGALLPPPTHPCPSPPPPRVHPPPGGGTITGWFQKKTQQCHIAQDCIIMRARC